MLGPKTFDFEAYRRVKEEGARNASYEYSRGSRNKSYGSFSRRGISPQAYRYPPGNRALFAVEDAASLIFSPEMRIGSRTTYHIISQNLFWATTTYRTPWACRDRPRSSRF